MSTMVQLRNVPDDIDRTLKARAAGEGLTMSDYVLREVRKALEPPRPPWLYASCEAELNEFGLRRTRYDSPPRC